MAKLHSLSSSSSAGISSHFTLRWDSFVEYVLDVTIRAYENMRKDAILHTDYDEETLSAIFAEDYIDPVAHIQPPYLIVTTEVRVINQDMKSGIQNIRESPKIDIKMFGSWQKDYKDKYFAWECKKVTDQSDLIGKYIKLGIFRFCDGVYSSNVNNAGMIGYVVTGDISKIVDKINQSMISPRRERTLPSKENLVLDKTRHSLSDIYTSTHERASNTNILLHHLFLTFNWIKSGTGVSA